MKDDQKALFICVNKKDKVIGHKTRFECHHNKDIIHRGVDVVLFNRKKDTIILQKRSNTKDTYPGYYTISASGHVDKGETYLQAAYREMNEELGIINCKKIVLTKVAKYIVSYPHESEMTTLFTGVYTGELNPSKDEVESILCVKIINLSAMKDTITPGGQAALYKLGLL